MRGSSFPPLCSFPNAERRYRRQGSPTWSSGQQPRPTWTSRRALTCCGMPAATSSRTMAHDTHAIQAYLGLRNIRNTPHSLGAAVQGGFEIEGRRGLGSVSDVSRPLFGNSLVDGNACFEHPWPNLTCLSPQN